MLSAEHYLQIIRHHRGVTPRDKPGWCWQCDCGAWLERAEERPSREVLEEHLAEIMHALARGQAMDTLARASSAEGEVERLKIALREARMGQGAGGGKTVLVSDYHAETLRRVEQLAEWAGRAAQRWLPFGSHVYVTLPDGLEFDGEGEDGLPLWERPKEKALMEGGEGLEL